MLRREGGANHRFANTMQTYNTLPFQKANPLQQLTGMSRALALPHEFPPQRLPSFPALERTAVMAFTTMTSLDVSRGMSATSTRGFLCRQAAWPLWYEQKSSFQPWQYTVVYDLQSALSIGTGNTTLHFDQYPSYIGADGNNAPTSFCPGTGGFSASPFKYPLLGLDSGLGSSTPFIYVPAGASLTVTCLAPGPVTADTMLEINFEKWVSPGTAMDTSIAVGLVIFDTKTTAGNSFTPGGFWLRPVTCTDLTNQGTIPAGSGMKFSFTVSNCSGITSAEVAPGTMRVITAGNIVVSALVPSGPPPEYANSTIPYQSTRLTAVGALFTNVTKLLNKEGVVYSARLSPANVDVFNFTQTDVVAVHPAEKAQLALEHGFYTYCPPSTDLALFQDYTCAGVPGGGGTWAALDCPFFRLDNTALVNAFVFVDSDATTTTNLAVTLDWHIEFRTTSTLFQIGLSGVTLETLHQAQLALVQLGFFYNNDDHKSIAMKVLPKIASIAKAYGGVPGMLGTMATRMMSKAPPKPPKVSRTIVSSPGGQGGSPKPKGKSHKPKAKGRK